MNVGVNAETNQVPVAIVESELIAVEKIGVAIIEIVLRQPLQFQALLNIDVSD